MSGPDTIPGCAGRDNETLLYMSYPTTMLCDSVYPTHCNRNPFRFVRKHVYISWLGNLMKAEAEKIGLKQFRCHPRSQLDVVE